MNALTQISPAAARLPQTYESAKNALTQCVALDECKDWSDKAAALASYAKQADDDELYKMAMRIKARAIRRAGELLQQIEPKYGANQNITDGSDSKVFTRTDAAREAGMSERQQVTAIRVSNIPTHDFDQQVESDKPPTLSQLAVQGIKRPQPKPVLDLKGRDPDEFNLAMHYVTGWEMAADDIRELKHDRALAILNPSEVARLRAAIASIDAATDHVITRI